MQFVVLFIIAVLWAMYLVSWAKGRSEHRSVNSISSFSKHLSVLERAAPGRSVGHSPQWTVPSAAAASFGPVGYRPGSTAMSRRQARERRKNILSALSGAALMTLALAVLMGGSMVYLQLLADMLLGGYVVALVQMRRMAEERQQKVRYLHAPIEHPVGPALVLQRSAR